MLPFPKEDFKIPPLKKGGRGDLKSSQCQGRRKRKTITDHCPLNPCRLSMPFWKFLAPGINLSARHNSSLHPDLSVFKRRQSGITAALERSQGGLVACHQRLKYRNISYFCVPICGNFSGCRHGKSHLAQFSGFKPSQKWLSHPNIIIICLS
jgi:hypothetical protein